MNYKLLFDPKRKTGVANDDFKLNTKGPKLDTGKPKLSDFLPQPVDNVAGFGLV